MLLIGPFLRWVLAIIFDSFLVKLFGASLKYILLSFKMSSIYHLPAVWTWPYFCPQPL